MTNAYTEDVDGTAAGTAGGGDLFSSVTGGRLHSVALGSGDALLGKLEVDNVGDFTEGEETAPDCDVCCASLARRLVYALRLSFLRAGPGVTALVTAGEKGDGGATATGDCVAALLLGGIEADSGVSALSAQGEGSTGSGFIGTSNRGGSGWGAGGPEAGVVCVSEAEVGHGGGGGCIGGWDGVEIASSPGASGISSVFGLGGLGAAGSSASGISTSAAGVSSGSSAGVAFVASGCSTAGSATMSMVTVSSDGAVGVLGDGLLEATSTRAGD